MTETYLTSKEVRARLKISPSTLRRLEKAGVLNPVKIGSVKRYKANELNK